MSGQGLQRRGRDIMAIVDNASTGRDPRLNGATTPQSAPVKTPEQVRSDFIRGSGPKTRGPMRRGY